MASTTNIARARHSLIVASALLTCAAGCTGAPPQPPPLKHPPLDRAHSHNDYTRTRPLQDALDLGFCSIEADVWLEGDELWVGHDKSELKPQRTLEPLYFRPLADRCASRDGWVYDPGRTVTLLVDLKTGGKSYEALKRLMRRYPALFESRDVGDPASGAKQAPPIEVIVSGDRPLKEFAAEEHPICAIDGRIADYETETSAERMPLVSDAWPSQFAWSGEGEFPAGQRDKLRRLVDDVHAHGRRLRFWATPDNEAVWAALLDEGVDVIGADDIQKLAKFLAARKPAAESTR